MKIPSSYTPYLDRFLRSPVAKTVFRHLVSSGSGVSAQTKVMEVWFAVLFAPVIVYRLHSFSRREIVSRDSPPPLIDPSSSSSSQESSQEGASGSDAMRPQPLPTEPRPLPQGPALLEHKTWRKYTGDLTVEQRRSIKCSFRARETILQLTLADHTAYHVLIRAQGIFNKTEVIVNQISQDVDSPFGIDRHIYVCGGFEYQQEDRRLQQKAEYRNGYQIGHANMIKSGKLADLGIERVIVVAGPKRSAFETNRDAAESALYSCYYNSLVLAQQRTKTSISFPLIMNGKDKLYEKSIIHISLKAIYDFIHQHPTIMSKTISVDFRSSDKEKLLTYFWALKAK